MRRLAAVSLLLFLFAWAAVVWPQHGRPGVGGTNPSVGQPGTSAPAGGSVYDSATAIWNFNDPADLGADALGTYDLTEVNTPTATGGALGYSTQFTATSSEYANIADNDSLSGDNASDIAVCAWSVKGANNTAIASKYITAGAKEWYFYYVGGTVGFAISVNGSSFANQDTGAAHSTGERSLLCGWHDVSATTIYATENDDAFDSGTTQSGAIDNTSAQFVVGAEGTPGSYSNNVIGPVMYWKGDLGDFTTVRDSVYNSTKGKACADLTTAEKVNLISCWDMTEDGGPYADSIGSNNLTGVNTPTRAAGLVERSDSGMSTQVVGASSQALRTAQTAANSSWSGVTSVAGWVMRTSSGTGHESFWINGGSAFSATHFSCGIDGGVSGQFMSVGGSDDGDYKTAAIGSVSFNEWHLVACGIDSSKRPWISVDGSAKTVGSALTGNVAYTFNSGDFIGVHLLNSTAGTPGDKDQVFDNVAYWLNYDLTDANIAELYAAGAGLFYPETP